MMDLTHTLSVAHADEQSPGCFWHKDPACLCDVVVTEPMGDDLVTPPWLEAMFCNDEHDDDTWLHDAFDFMVGRTLLESIRDAEGNVGDVLGLLDNEELVADLLEDMSVNDAVAKHGSVHGNVQRLRKYLNLRTHGKAAQGMRNYHVRKHVVDRHFAGGERVIDIYRDLESKGVDLPAEVTLYQWVQRVRDAA